MSDKDLKRLNTKKQLAEDDINNDIDPRLIHLKIDSLTKRQVLITWLVIAVLILLFYIIGITVLPTTWYHYEGTEACTAGPSNINQFCKRQNFREDNVWEGYVFNINAFDQYQILEATPIKNKGKLGTDDLTFSTDVQVEINKIITIKDDDLDTEAQFTFENHKQLSHSVTFVCEDDRDRKGRQNRLCKPHTQALMPKIIKGNFQIKVTISTDGDYEDSIQGMIFEVMTVKRAFTQFQLGIRYSFLGLNFIHIIVYILHYRTIPVASRVIEQKYNILLVVALFFFNDPQTLAGILANHKAQIVIQCIFNSAFFAILNLYWLLMSSRIAFENSARVSSAMNIPKMIQAVLIFAMSLSSALVFYLQLLPDPAALEDIISGDDFKACHYSLIALFTITQIYLLYCVICIIRTWKTRVQRHKSYLSFTTFFIISISVIVYQEDFKYYLQEGLPQMFLICLNNVYVYLMQFLYSVSAKGRRELAIIERQHAFVKKTYDYLEEIDDIDQFGDFDFEETKMNIQKSKLQSEMKNPQDKDKSEFENMFGVELGETQNPNKPSTFKHSDRSKDYQADYSKSQVISKPSQSELSKSIENIDTDKINVKNPNKDIQGFSNFKEL